MPIQVGPGPIVNARPVEFDSKESMLIRESIGPNPTDVEATIEEE